MSGAGRAGDAHGFDRVVMISNRGPIAYEGVDDGRIVARRGAGGLVTAVGDVLRPGDVWLSATMSEADRMVSRDPAVAVAGPRDPADVRAGFGGSVQMLDIEPDLYDEYYNAISNGMLWFVHHYLWESARAPTWDAGTRIAWERYVEVNRRFAMAAAGQGNAQERTAYLVQDYHLALVPRMLRELSPDASIAHFTHTPFAGPTYLRTLPTSIRHDLLRGLLGADVLGFHSNAWAENFLACARELPETRVDVRRSRVRVGDRTVAVKTHPMSIDVGPLQDRARQPSVDAAREELRDILAGRRMVLRVDRLELSKNILRGALAFEQALIDDPDLRGSVTMLALLVTSRSDLEAYARYAQDCRAEIERINDRFGTPAWRPIEMRADPGFDLVLAAYEGYDVLVVNPVIDGLNLVSLEGPALNRRKGVLVLSRNAGSFERLRRYVLAVNPFDVQETADALRAGLEMREGERSRSARGLARLVRSNPPSRWLDHQMADLERAAVPPAGVEVVERASA